MGTGKSSLYVSYRFNCEGSYLLECRTEHLGYTATKVAIKAMKARGLRANVILIEDKANGSAVIEELRREDLGAALIAVNPEGGKESRAFAASADVEAGNVYLPDDAPWLSEFLHVHTNFPAVKHDDCVDSATQFLNWRRTGVYSFPLAEYYERLQARWEAEASGNVKLYTCVAEIDGERVLLHFDELRRLWFDPRKPEITYPEREDS
jgi:predicted phage terminase large subunit-like protein